MLVDSEAQNWAGVVAEAKALDASLAKFPGTEAATPTMTEALVAYGLAKLGDVAAAQTRIAATPADCYPCLIARAQIAELAGQRAGRSAGSPRAVGAGAFHSFRLCRLGPGAAGSRRPGAAIAKFTLANQKGPHFADPLESWGEALMKQNRSDRALAKFEEAEKYAPNWGRLHLKWGEALVYAGQKDEAQKQFALAATLDLSAADKAELARVSRMAEEADGPDTGQRIRRRSRGHGAGAGQAPAAARRTRFLEEQTALAVDQRHHLHEQFKQLHLGIWEKRMGVLLRVATA